MSQTAYSVDPALAFRGLLADPNDDKFAIPMANGAAAAQGFGIMVRRDAANPADQFDIFSAAGQAPLGVTVHTQAQEDPSLAGSLGIALLEPASVLRRGRVWVRVEEAIAVTDGVFYRHTSGSGTEIGAFRNDADGAAEVSTLTPNPVVNDTVYTVDMHILDQDYHFEILSDGTATATEICDAMRAAMALDAQFTALVVASGTTTLILTSQVAGLGLVPVSSGPGLFDIVETTPPVPTCEEIVNAQWLQGSTGAGVALLELNLP
jgi:hypothetical protein